jgi:hypothetical protein
MTKRSLGRAAWVPAVCGACASAGSCKSGTGAGPAPEPPGGGLRPTVIEYVDADGFDSLFESALKNADPVILIQTETAKPDWGARLNAWIAAWNRGGKAAEGAPRTARGQSPLSINGESIREFRLLVDDLMGKVETLADKGSAWWAEERTRSRRVALLRPYSLRFHQGEDKNIQLIFFHGAYAAQYRDFMATLADGDVPDGWARTVECSRCKKARAEAKLVGHPLRAVSAGAEEE